jgi:hypothetical protein
MSSTVQFGALATLVPKLRLGNASVSEGSSFAEGCAGGDGTTFPVALLAKHELLETGTFPSS